MCEFECALTSYPQLLCFGFPRCWLCQWACVGLQTLLLAVGCSCSIWSGHCSLQNSSDLSALLAFSCLTPDSQTHVQGQNVCITGRYYSDAEHTSRWSLQRLSQCVLKGFGWSRHLPASPGFSIWTDGVGTYAQLLGDLVAPVSTYSHSGDPTWPQHNCHLPFGLIFLCCLLQGCHIVGGSADFCTLYILYREGGNKQWD